MRAVFGELDHVYLCPVLAAQHRSLCARRYASLVAQQAYSVVALKSHDVSLYVTQRHFDALRRAVAVLESLIRRGRTFADAPF